ncbi:conserved hypothetical protein [Paracholeplasma brassicae]|uniref:HTH cro/C1-type domain-containing protein n=1 Tax=Acholeplasma brassicae TaxID=61635 RepID=U4KSM0_9MOLU|nr:hypothetical protein [Paracholeplasma brassicae]CCV65174.1 conserved hypothetical protein [Paracholeplasma brassicae]
MNEIDQTREIITFIDKLRAYRNMTQENFLHNIVSMRQYRRYMNGDSTMSYMILDKLARRLDFDAELIIMEYEAEKIKQAQEINNLYNAVVGRNYDKASELFKSIDVSHVISTNEILLYNHSKNMYQYVTGSSSQVETIKRTKELVDYDKLLKRKALSSSELLILVSFFYFDSFKEINVIAEKLASFIENNITVVTGHNIKIVTLVLEELARFFSISENYERMLYYSLEGIKYSLSVRSFYLLDTLYYFAAASSHELQKYDQRDDFLKKCYILLMIDNNKTKQQRFKQIYKNRFNIDINDLLIEKE